MLTVRERDGDRADRRLHAVHRGPLRTFHTEPAEQRVRVEMRVHERTENPASVLERVASGARMVEEERDLMEQRAMHRPRAIGERHGLGRDDVGEVLPQVVAHRPGVGHCQPHLLALAVVEPGRVDLHRGADGIEDLERGTTGGGEEARGDADSRGGLVGTGFGGHGECSTRPGRMVRGDR